MKPLIYIGALAVAGSVIVACAGNGANVGTSAPAPASKSQDHRKVRPNGVLPVINHIFVIVQENRSVDNLFNGFPGADTVTQGYAGNMLVSLQPLPLKTPFDPGHVLKSFEDDTGCQGRYSNPPPCPMSGFPAPIGADPRAYSYVPQSYTQPYWQMASEYVFGDRMFTSHLDASFVSHQYLIAAQANSTVNLPFSEPCPTTQVYTINYDRSRGGAISACAWTNVTIADELKTKNLRWRYYVAAPLKGQGHYYWNPFYYYVNTTASANVITPPSQFITDITTNPSSYDAAVTWITPSFPNSDHSNGTDNTGPNWVGSVVNAIGESPLWDTSVIFITWDDWGGWYDHVPPPFADTDGLGIRVPFIIISPYTTSNTVTHVQYEQASILRFIEDHFGLPQMSTADGRATDPSADVFSNSNPTPRPFATITVGPYDADQPGDPDPD